jgi:hypothetical protein
MLPLISVHGGLERFRQAGFGGVQLLGQACIHGVFVQGLSCR